MRVLIPSSELCYEACKSLHVGTLTQSLPHSECAVNGKCSCLDCGFLLSWGASGVICLHLTLASLYFLHWLVWLWHKLSTSPGTRGGTGLLRSTGVASCHSQWLEGELFYRERAGVKKGLRKIFLEPLPEALACACHGREQWKWLTWEGWSQWRTLRIWELAPLAPKTVPKSSQLCRDIFLFC